MVEGILWHNTDKVINKIYVDTCGVSEVDFAFSHLLGFELSPRLKNINAQKLYYADKNDSSKYNN